MKAYITQNMACHSHGQSNREPAIIAISKVKPTLLEEGDEDS